MLIAGSRFRRRARVVAAFILCVLLLALGAWVSLRWPWWSVTARQEDDPRLAYSGPFRNVRPEVRYVGDDRCASCHPEQATSFRDHPMGRSLTPVAQAPPVERFGREANNPFTFLNLQFAVERRGGRIIHK